MLDKFFRKKSKSAELPPASPADPSPVSDPVPIEVEAVMPAPEVPTAPVADIPPPPLHVSPSKPRTKAEPAATTQPPEATALVPTSDSAPDEKPAVMLRDKTGKSARAVERLTNEELENRLTKRLNLIENTLMHLDGAMLKAKIEKAGIRDLAIYEGILMDKLQLVRGQPTQILSHEKRSRLSDVLPALIQEMNRRGMVVHPTKVINADPG